MEGRLNWADARPVAKEYFQFWPDGEDYLWAKYCWAALEKSGLSIYHNEKEELECRSYIGLLAILYQELCFPFNDEFHWITPDLWKEIKEDTVVKLEQKMDLVKSALINNIGKIEFYRYTLLSIYSGSQGAVLADINTKMAEEQSSLIEDSGEPYPYYVFRRVFETSTDFGYWMAVNVLYEANS